MAARAAFSGHATGQIIPSKAMVGALHFLPMKKCQLKINNTKSVGRHIYMKARTWNKSIGEHRLKVVMSSASSYDIGPNPLSSSDSIKQFYTSINEKNLNKLCEFISDDCYFDNCSFIKPFQGEKEVMEFFGQLIASMGQNVKFKIGHVCEGDDFTTGVTWRLGFLKSPQSVLQVILRIYNMVLGLFVSPFLAWYLNLWKFMAIFLSYTLQTLLFISKIFFK
ncbi:hypothetical protein LOK49_LG11G02736 [Camellia lanceoleosa]|uniref:Uncharacterized protein n=1 Tax=Camellia lanceoleosa TaxID=1840588 RepID=A0ACC0G1C9_9ERIC|nr:hypothetical protein LOK49_LG11G02736 [Camellia lanceoleosa]